MFSNLEITVSTEEHTALLALARYVRLNTERRTRPPAELVRLINQVAKAQGKPLLWADFKDGVKQKPKGEK